jgi:hypothetical protein
MSLRYYVCEITYDIYGILPAFIKYIKWEVINPTYKGTGKGIVVPAGQNHRVLGENFLAPFLPPV